MQPFGVIAEIVERAQQAAGNPAEAVRQHAGQPWPIDGRDDGMAPGARGHCTGVGRHAEKPAVSA
ncbi:hypothetical protein ACWGKQ_11015 [Streptomyces sp. NPDC054770]